MRSVTTTQQESAMNHMNTRGKPVATSAINPGRRIADTIRFAAGVTVATTGAALWLADLAYAYGGTA
jgi:hypothetical protein